MSKKIFLSIFLVSTFFLLLSLFVVSGVLYTEFLENEKNYLWSEIKFIKEVLIQNDVAFSKNLKDSSYRLTLISDDGKVLFDSKANVSEMENHSDRHEIQKAKKIGSGESHRYSNTLMEKTIYVATQLPSKTIIRISTSINSIWSMILELIPSFIFIFIFLSIFSGILSHFLSIHIVTPLNNLNLDDPISNKIYDEVSPLLSRIHQQNRKIKQQMTELQQKVDENINAQNVRAEFSANVSHELKTPLQSIIGYTELLENNLVKPEDTSRFISSIKKESQRLVALINDIIHLSQLDENEEVKFEKTNLDEIITETISLLKSSAIKKNITLNFTNISRSPFIYAVPLYVQEIVYNLIDNAIRYNKKNGTVFISLKPGEKGKIVFTVEDTGIGIPQEDQERIFERFYRVDKSHSRETGGTGLGLSIVKHAVQIHKAKLKLFSQVDNGTKISVDFIQ